MNSDSGNTQAIQLRNAILRGLLIGALLGAAFAAGFLFRDLVNQPGQVTSFALLSEAESLLAEHFLYEAPDEAARVHGAVAGLVAAYDDPYTFFVEPQTAEVDAGNLAGRFGGIGVELSHNADGEYVIARVYRDGPADNAGLIDDDVLLAVDDVLVSLDSHDMGALVALIRGEIGELVVLTIRRGSETLDYEVIRDEVLVPSTFWRVLEDQPDIGYIQITRFTERAPEELDTAFAELQEAGVAAYVLDLRGNGGGRVDSAVSILNEFFEDGVLLYEERSNQPEKTFTADSGGDALDEPIVILVDSGTASAAEIVAGAMQDRDRAIIVGQQTFGKGSVQLILPMSDGSSMHVTNAQWFTPNRSPIEHDGLTPDFPITPIEGEDVALQTAIALLLQ